MEQKPVDDLERHFLQVFVRPMDRVAGLEADHRLPGALGFDLSDLRRRQIELRKTRAGPRERHNLAADGPAPRLLQNADPGMRVVLGSVDAQRFTPDVCFVSSDDIDDADRFVADEKSNPVRSGNFVGAKDDRDGEGCPAGQAALLDDRLVVIAVHVPVQWRERAGAEHEHIGELTLPNLQSGKSSCLGPELLELVT